MKDLRNSVSRAAAPTARPARPGTVPGGLRPAWHEQAPAVRYATVDESGAGQRLDNFLIRELKGVPRSRIYRIVRDGQVRVNGGRVDVTRRLAAGDQVRIPPLRTGVREPAQPRPLEDADLPVIFEDDALLVVDKPAGMAVHGGSGVSFGAIERLRAARPTAKVLELAHRLDRETSGLLIVAKKRSALTALHAAWGDGSIRKIYIALVRGKCEGGTRAVEFPLRKYVSRTGERRVSVDRNGQFARTIVTPVATTAEVSLVEAALDTGRTHQIRVHLAHLEHPILGDEKYGDFALNRAWTARGLRRMFLHATRLEFVHPLTATPMQFDAPLPIDLAAVCQGLFGTVPAAAPEETAR